MNTQQTKVFIPDNQGGGTWEPWQDNRPNYKEHADKLAEALRGIRDNWERNLTEPMQDAMAALDAYEKAKGGPQ